MTVHQVRVALDWTPNTIHSGLFIAQQKGFYAQRKLHVELLSPDAEYSKTPAKRLEAGEVDLAICPSESCIAYHESGKMALQAIYAILQRDASAIVSLNLSGLQDLAGKTYGSYNARYEDATVRAMVTAAGGSGRAMQIQQSEGKLSLFEAMKAGRVDATWIFLPWEGIEAKLEGIEIKTYQAEDFAIPYGYSPVIARNVTKSLPTEILHAFVAATQEGYQYAMDPAHAHEVFEVLKEKCVPERSEEFLLKSQASINTFYSDGFPLGTMQADKWRAWANWLRGRKLLQGPPGFEGKLFTNAFFIQQ